MSYLHQPQAIDTPSSPRAMKGTDLPEETILPAGKPDLDGSETDHPDSKVPGKGPAHPLGERARLSRLLIVEDDPSQLRTLTDIFEDEGFEVIGCRLAHEALQHVEKEDFSVAILDLRLPDYNGTQLLARITALKNRVRVIIHTAYGSFDSAKEAVNLGAFAYVEKLSDPAELVRHVHRAVREHIDRYASELEDAVAERTRALRQSEEKYRELIENANDIIYTYDLSGQFTSFNAAGERLTGYHRADVLKMNIAQLVPPGQLASAGSLLERDLHGDETDTSEWEIIARDGRHIPLEVSTRLVLDAEGNPVAVQGIARDITDRKKAEELRVRFLEQVMAAQEEERRRIARDLHDEIGQTLTSLLIGLRTVANASTLEMAQKRAGELREVAANALDEVRRLARGLRPTVLDDLGLTAALEHLAAGFAETHSIPVDVYVRGLESERLPSLLETAIYRIVQEALTNVAKHAGARTVSIVVERQPSSLRVIIEDDGKGLDPNVEVERFGLSTMRERAALLGGMVTLESAPGQGTTVVVSIPL